MFSSANENPHIMTQPDTSINLSSHARVATALRTLGVDSEIVVFDESTRTSAEAAATIGCDVAQIAKSIVFRGKHSDRCILVIASGADRIDEKKLKREMGEPITKADAGFVRDRTGFVIGGVAPVGHQHPVTILIDEKLLAIDPVWAAAGTPNAVFRLRSSDLCALPETRVANVSQ